MDAPDSPEGADGGRDGGFEALAELAREPRLLHDLRFLGTLHAQLDAALGAAETAEALLQVGFLQGLSDATRLLRFGFVEGESPAGLSGAPALAMHLAPAASDLPPGAVEVRGSWPEQREARARALAPASEGGSCWASAGYTSGWLSGLLETDLLAIETRCTGRGDDACAFIAREPEAWRQADPEQADLLLRWIDFARCREAVASELGEEPAAGREGAFDRREPVVHVWGPVMVVPFSGPDESLEAIDLIRREAPQIRAVVLDLGGIAIDEAFGALAVERVVAAAQEAGAEVILCGVSPLADRAIASLESGPALVEKDLPQAVAAAFRLADAQRGAA